MAGKLDITIDQGSKFTVHVLIKDSGVPRDLTGYTFRAKALVKFTDSSAYATFTVGIRSGYAATDGRLTVSLTAVETAALTLPNGILPTERKAKVAYWDLEILAGGAEAAAERILDGVVFLSREATK